MTTMMATSRDRCTQGQCLSALENELKRLKNTSTFKSMPELCSLNAWMNLKGAVEHRDTNSIEKCFETLELVLHCATGINLSTSSDLYTEYTRKKNDLIMEQKSLKPRSIQQGQVHKSGTRCKGNLLNCIDKMEKELMHMKGIPRLHGMGNTTESLNWQKLKLAVKNRELISVQRLLSEYEYEIHKSTGINWNGSKEICGNYIRIREDFLQMVVEEIKENKRGLHSRKTLHNLPERYTQDSLQLCLYALENELEKMKSTDTFRNLPELQSLNAWIKLTRAVKENDTHSFEKCFERLEKEIFWATGIHLSSSSDSYIGYTNKKNDILMSHPQQTTVCHVRVYEPVETPANTPSKRECNICMERPKDSFFFPCGHTVCMVCGVQVKELGQNCPTCRGQIERIQPLYE